MPCPKSTFALFIGNRGFFSSSMLSESLLRLKKALTNTGFKVITPDYSQFPKPAIEKPKDGEAFAEFLRINQGKFDGIILSLPNFGDETGAVAALKSCRVPILIHAFPDELDQMNMNNRRDAFCGKFAIMNLFTQYKIPYTIMTPHVVAPESEKFLKNIKCFDKVCKIYQGMRNINIGAFGARTTPFKAVRYDELTLQRNGISVETFDLSDIFSKIKTLDTSNKNFISKSESLKNYCRWDSVPDKAFINMVKLGLVIDDYIKEYELNALALRCWDEIQRELGISPCVLISELNERGIAAACELDVSSAVAMQALNLASDFPAACFDWNNNYGEDSDKCILFHCGPAPRSMLKGEGVITEHKILSKTLPECTTYGCLTGRLKSSPVSCCGMMTIDGKLTFYLLEGEITSDTLPDDFFGCAGVVKINDLQQRLLKLGQNGFRHHTALTQGHVSEAVREVFKTYLNFSLINFQS